MALRAAISSSMSHLPAAAFKGELSYAQDEIGRVPALKGGLHGLIGGSHQFRQFAFLAVLYQYLRQFIVVFTHVIKSIKCVKLYSTFCISYTIRTNGLLYLTGHNECPLLTILLT